ncbi:unnamed protein product [Pylaiella littoralis]
MFVKAASAGVYSRRANRGRVLSFAAAPFHINASIEQMDVYVCQKAETAFVCLFFFFFFLYLSHLVRPTYSSSVSCRRSTMRSSPLLHYVCLDGRCVCTTKPISFGYSDYRCSSPVISQRACLWVVPAVGTCG